MLPSRILLQLYKPKRPWPPDFSLLTPKHQFSLERRYRRRAKLKWARPKLQKFVKSMQLGSSVLVIWYAVFWADWGNTHPFGPLREWASDLKSSFWSIATPPPRPEFSTPRGSSEKTR
ncbi:uncharacterized protein LAJ45_09393 [Morchella importuna]|uniref:Uncharacterized protein n=1 Tax=Morchella conica CCBAS932 TaxID=1392247 RepID=A0A3N4L0Q7_9PEZI|nr:uncharacterized protein LAJ45_09393 [Morchella importuna]KAH8146447.1 hypothetical protein LAJ45_09393 [Morchella importuna]RPB11565.1 hypothetical protein P167DRAFT_524063 [Morchella conica CCBAS932]